MEFASKKVYNYGGVSSDEGSDDENNSSTLQPTPPVLSGYNFSNINVGAPPPPPPPPQLVSGGSPPPPPPPPGPGGMLSHGSPPPPPPQQQTLPGVSSCIPPAPPIPPPHQGDQKKKKKGGARRKTDTNVISVKFECLEQNIFSTTDKPEKCSHCSAVMSDIDETFNDLNSTESSMKWKCAFCSTVNSISVENAKHERKGDILYIPESESVTSEQQSAAADKDAKGNAADEKDKIDTKDDSILLFTLDISGSMGTTVCKRSDLVGNTDILGDDNDDDDDTDDDSFDDTDDRTSNVQKKSVLNFFSGFAKKKTPPPPSQTQTVAVKKHRKKIKHFGGGDDQYMSRLAVTQEAISQRLVDLKTSKPNLKLGIVTFCTEVEYLADGTKSKQKILNKNYKDHRDEIQNEGLSCKIPGPITDSWKHLKSTIEGMKPTSMTALGPALLMSVAIAGQQNQSKVIICTDGCANVGIGSLDRGSGDGNEGDDFYDYVSEYANEFGVSVSVLAIEGADCRLVSLGKVADATNGEVNIVKPTDLSSEYSAIIADKIVGSKVTVTLILHTSMYIRDALKPEDKSKSVLTLKMGNVTNETEKFIEFGFKPTQGQESGNKDENKKTQSGDEEDKNEGGKEEKSGGGDQQNTTPNELPFQLQISYINKNKVQMLRVITTKMPMTKDRSDAEKDANVVLMGAHAIQTTAECSKNREYTKAQGYALSKKNWLNNIKYSRPARDETESQAYLVMDRELDDYCQDLSRQQQVECAMFGGNLSDDDSGDEQAQAQLRMKKRMARSKAQSDQSSNMMFKNSKMNQKFFMKK